MRSAGYRGPDVFLPGAIALIARASHGLTRRINILSDKALLAAYTENSHAVAERQVRAAIADSEFAAVKRAPVSRAAVLGVAALIAGVAIGALIPWERGTPPTPPPAAKPQPVVAPQPKPAAVVVAAASEDQEDEDEELELYAQAAL